VAGHAGVDLAVHLQVLDGLTLGVMVALAAALGIEIRVLLGVILGVLLVTELDLTLGDLAVFAGELDDIAHRGVDDARAHQTTQRNDHRYCNLFPHTSSSASL